LSYLRRGSKGSPGDFLVIFHKKIESLRFRQVKEKIKNYLDLNPKRKRVVGIVLVIIGGLSIITPFTPVGFLLLVGLELLGIRHLLWSKIKPYLKQD